jgi:hypothetical protein
MVKGKDYTSHHGKLGMAIVLASTIQGWLGISCHMFRKWDGQMGARPPLRDVVAGSCVAPLEASTVVSRWKRSFERRVAIFVAILVTDAFQGRIRFVHRWFGRLILVAAAVQIYLGMQLYAPTEIVVKELFLSWLAAVLAIFVYEETEFQFGLPKGYMGKLMLLLHQLKTLPRLFCRDASPDASSGPRDTAALIGSCSKQDRGRVAAPSLQTLCPALTPHPGSLENTYGATSPCNTVFDVEQQSELTSIVSLAPMTLMNRFQPSCLNPHVPCWDFTARSFERRNP